MATSNGPAPADGLLGGKRVESGRNSYTGVSFHQWGSSSWYVTDIPANITFGKAFSSLPTVIATVDGTNTSSGSVSNVKYTKTGITSFAITRPTESIDTECIICWLAIGN